MKPDQKFFVFDVESQGLHGQAFAVAGGTYDIHGKAVVGSEFAFHCNRSVCETAQVRSPKDAQADRQWVSDNVLIRESSIGFGDRGSLIQKFWEQWEFAKDQHSGVLMFVEWGWPVEARFLIECIDDADYLKDRNWDGPCPMHEIATLMLAAGMDPKATYDRLPEEQPAHEPLADSRLSARLLATAINRLDEAAGVCMNEGIGPDILSIEAD